MKFLKFSTFRAGQVSGYISLYTEGGAEDLLIRRQPGRTKFLTDGQEKELFHIISTCAPEEAGVGIFADWTVPLACRLVEEHKKYDAEVFPGFLKTVLQKYPSGKIVMILDNAKIHHAKLLQG